MTEVIYIYMYIYIYIDPYDLIIIDLNSLLITGEEYKL
jgi:hypothetical protein